MYFIKNFIVKKENIKDNKIPTKANKLNSTLCLNRSFILKMLAAAKAGIER